MYGSSGTTNVGPLLAAIKINIIQNRAGQILRNSLLDRFNPGGEPSVPQFILSVETNEAIAAKSIKKSAVSTRATLTLSVRFSLTGTKSPLKRPLSGSIKVKKNYNMLVSKYATLVAEQDARKNALKEISYQLAHRIATYFQQTGFPRD